MQGAKFGSALVLVWCLYSAGREKIRAFLCRGQRVLPDIKRLAMLASPDFCLGANLKNRSSEFHVK